MSQGCNKEDYLEALLESIEDNIKDEGACIDIRGRLLNAFRRSGASEEKIREVEESFQRPHEGDFVERLTQIFSKRYFESSAVVPEPEISIVGASGKAKNTQEADISTKENIMSEEAPGTPAKTTEQILDERVRAEIRKQIQENEIKAGLRPKEYDPFNKLK